MKKCKFLFSLFVLPLVFACGGNKTEVEEPVKESDKESRKEDYLAPEISDKPIVDYNLWKIENGKFYLDGKWVFLKVGKPLINFANAGQVDKLISNLDVLRKNILTR